MNPFNLRCPGHNLIKVCLGLCRLQFPLAGLAACDQMIYAALGNFSPQKEIRALLVLADPALWLVTALIPGLWLVRRLSSPTAVVSKEEEDLAPCRFCLSRPWSVSDTFKVAQTQHYSYDPWLWAVKEHVVALNLPCYLYFRLQVTLSQMLGLGTSLSEE